MKWTTLAFVLSCQISGVSASHAAPESATSGHTSTVSHEERGLGDEGASNQEEARRAAEWAAAHEGHLDEELAHHPEVQVGLGDEEASNQEEARRAAEWAAAHVGHHDEEAHTDTHKLPESEAAEGGVVEEAAHMDEEAKKWADEHAPEHAAQHAVDAAANAAQRDHAEALLEAEREAEQQARAQADLDALAASQAELEMEASSSDGGSGGESAHRAADAAVAKGKEEEEEQHRIKEAEAAERARVEWLTEEAATAAAEASAAADAAAAAEAAATRAVQEEKNEGTDGGDDDVKDNGSTDSDLSPGHQEAQEDAAISEEAHEGEDAFIPLAVEDAAVLMQFDCSSYSCPAPGGEEGQDQHAHQFPWSEWHSSGSTALHARGAILTEDVPGAAGSLWAVRPFRATGGMDLEMRFRVGGSGAVGADGMALWFTAKGLAERFEQKMGFGVKHAFGHVDRWTGLGLFLDTFENDPNSKFVGGRRRVPSGSNSGGLYLMHPRVVAIVNDGSFYWDHDLEGIVEGQREGESGVTDEAAAAAAAELNEAKRQKLVHEFQPPPPPQGGHQQGGSAAGVAAHRREMAARAAAGRADDDSDDKTLGNLAAAVGEAKKAAEEAAAKAQRLAGEASEARRQQQLHKITELEKLERRHHDHHHGEDDSHGAREGRRLLALVSAEEEEEEDGAEESGDISDDDDDVEDDDGDYDDSLDEVWNSTDSYPLDDSSDANSTSRSGPSRRQLLRRHHRSRKRQKAAAAKRRQQAGAQRALSLGLANEGRLDACHMPFRRILKPSQMIAHTGAKGDGSVSLSEEIEAAQLDAWLRVTYQPDTRTSGGRESVLTVFAGSAPPPSKEKRTPHQEAALGSASSDDKPTVVWSQCARLRGVTLPEVGYFGMSASTGDLSDRHEVVSFRAMPFAGDDADALESHEGASAPANDGGAAEEAEAVAQRRAAQQAEVDAVKAAADAAGTAAVAAAKEAEEAAQAASEAQRMATEAHAQAQQQQHVAENEQRKGHAHSSGTGGSRLEDEREARRRAAERVAEEASVAAAARAEEAARSAEAAKAKAVKTAREVRESMKMTQSNRFADMHRKAASEANKKKLEKAEAQVTDDAGVDDTGTGSGGKGLWWWLQVLVGVVAVGAVAYYALVMTRRQADPLLPVSGRKYN